MSIQNVSTLIQNNSEQYKIRKQTEAQQTEQLQQEIQEQKVQEVEVDEYDKSNPAGEEVEGIYSVSHDDSGNLKVNYKQPESKIEAKQGSAPLTESADNSSDDDEVEELKKQRDAVKQQLNRETDETVKSQLRAQVRAIEVQIALKSANLQ